MLATTETSSENGDDFLKMIGYENVGEFPNAYAGKSGNGFGDVEQSEDVEKRFREIQEYYKKFVSKELLDRLYETYYWDFELFGYSIEGFHE